MKYINYPLELNLVGDAVTHRRKMDKNKKLKYISAIPYRKESTHLGIGQDIRGWRIPTPLSVGLT